MYVNGTVDACTTFSSPCGLGMKQHSIGLCMYTVAELVVWGPIGDQYSLAFEKSIAVYDVEVSVETCIVKFRS